MSAEIERRVVEFAVDQPAYGRSRVSNELKKEGVLISPCGVRSVWLRHDLESHKIRLKALEAKVAQEGHTLTESQLVSLAVLGHWSWGDGFAASLLEQDVRREFPGRIAQVAS